MANLPVYRLAAFVHPFTHTGIDYFGSMEVVIGKRVEKRWRVLLTYLTIRAVYIDLASSLSTSSCVTVTRNFMVRRGTPTVFYSDRETNFIDPQRELKQALLALDQHEMAQEFVSSTITWRFNPPPPASPHMGGNWERLIQSVKRTLPEFRLSRRPTEEELRNALIAVEGILNARPLTHVHIEEKAAPVRTPNHWLLGPWTEWDDDSTFLSRGSWLASISANGKPFLEEVGARVSAGNNPAIQVA
ncbi:uncharacterized protein LOC128745447 [Sabethes cyaneus]|uniref:uncharacterized protein LOC128745447 n=1 Tax=Sabethes cyaneus TaxID=53552 RepID=UPI00237E06B3|nr:uncharacterized protein LOC128745447 [Sabethes cyaneus]